MWILRETSYELEYQSFQEFDELTIINKTDKTKCFLIGFDSNEYLLNTLKNEKGILETYVDSSEKINGFDITVNGGDSNEYSFYRLSEDINYSIDSFAENQQLLVKELNELSADARKNKERMIEIAKILLADHYWFTRKKDKE